MEVVGVEMTGPEPEVIGRARRLRVRAHLAQLDYLRALLVAADEGYSHGEVARRLGLSQPAVSKAIKRAAASPPVLEGFSGSRPYEIAERFAVGDINRETAVAELAAWPYAPGDPGDGVDWMTYEPGEFEEVTQALRDGLLDDATYSAIQDRRDQLSEG